MPDLAGEAGGEKSLARADRAADHVAHRQHVGLAGADGRGGVLQLLLGRLVAGDHRKIEAALHELQQAAGFGLDQFLLALRSGTSS